MGDDNIVKECEADTEELEYVERGMMSSFLAPFVVLALVVVGYMFFGG